MKAKKTTSAFYLVAFRDDSPRERLIRYWFESHAQRAARMPGLQEYTPRLFSTTDSGFWPATDGVGTLIPPEWRFDGAAECRFENGLLGMAKTVRGLLPVSLDEQHCFRRVIETPTGPGGGRLWEGPDRTRLEPHYTAVLFSRRRGVSPRRFAAFLHEGLGPALWEAGARDVRTHAFFRVPVLFGQYSPGVEHSSPRSRRYHGAAVFATQDRAQVNEILSSEPLRAIIARQNEAIVAAHAYSVSRSVPLVGPQARGRSIPDEL